MTDDLKTAGDNLIAASKEYKADFVNKTVKLHEANALGDYKSALSDMSRVRVISRPQNNPWLPSRRR